MPPRESSAPFPGHFQLPDNARFTSVAIRVAVKVLVGVRPIQGMVEGTSHSPQRCDELYGKAGSSRYNQIAVECTSKAESRLPDK